MDSLTQIVLGAAVGEAVLGKKIGNKAILWGAIAGTIPDLDVIAKLFTDDITANELHRGFSHSILFSIIFAPVLGWIVYRLYKKKEANQKDWTKLMFWGLITHPILDAFTTWGTQLFWPLPYKLSFKNIFVIDPLYTIPFSVFLILAMFKKRTDPKRKKLNTIGLCVSSFYLFITLLLKWYTYTVFENSLIAQNIEYIEIQTKPSPLNSILWTANIETEKSFLIGDYSLLDKTQEVTFSKFEKNHHLLTDIKDDTLIHRLTQLTEGWYTIEKENDSIIFNDLRFGQLGVGTKAESFVFSYVLFYDQNGKLVGKEKEKKVQDASPLLRKLFLRILGNKQ